MNETPTESAPPATRGRLQLVVVAALFLGPLAVAALIYFGPGNWRPQSLTNNGELLDPIVSLPEARLDTRHGATTDATFLLRKWSLAYFAPGGCGEPCRRNLIKIRQIRLALGRESDRVQRVLLASGAMPSRDWFAETHPGLIYADPDTNAEFRTAWRSRPEGLYLIDPLGNLVMHYGHETKPGPVHDDLKKLLKHSRIG